MKKGVFHTNGFKPLEEVVRIIGKSEPNCDECPFRRDCGPGCVYKEVRWYLEEYLELHKSEKTGIDRLQELRKLPKEILVEMVFQMELKEKHDKVSRKEN